MADLITFDPVSQMECPSCKTMINVSGIPSFSKAICPSCGKELIVPAQLGNFKLLTCLGAGGMGSVYKAYDETLARIVAIKVMLKSLGSNPEFLESFRREAQAAAKLNHPNICQIYSFGEEKGQPYIVMELVPGKHFDEMITQPEPLDQAMVMKIGMDIADGLQLAAASNLIHGDIKPENILLDDRDVAKLVDFGIASTPSQGEGEIWGTPYYIAPEKLRRQRVDFRSDIYCLGGTLYHALTQHPPFDGEDAMAVVKARLAGPPEPMKTYRPDIDPEVAEIIDRMLQLEPAMRYPTYGSLLSDMRRYLSRVQPPAPSAATPSKRIVIKGRGRSGSTAQNNSVPQSSTVGMNITGKHSLVVSHGATALSNTQRSASQKIPQPSAVDAPTQITEENKSGESKGNKIVKGVLIALGIVIVIAAAAVGGTFYYLANKAKQVVAEVTELQAKESSAFSKLETLLAHASDVRDKAIPTNIEKAQAIVANAIAAVEAEVGTEFSESITYEEPEPEPEPSEAALPPDAATDGTTNAVDVVDANSSAADTNVVVDAEADVADAAPVAEETAAEELQPAKDESITTEPQLEGLPMMAREIFLALRPVRRAQHEAERTYAKIDELRFNATTRFAAKTNDLSMAQLEKLGDALNDVRDAFNVEITELGNDNETANALIEELDAVMNTLPDAFKDAEKKYAALLAETEKLKLERRRVEEEAEKERQLQIAKEKERAAEEARRQAEVAELTSIAMKVTEHQNSLKDFRVDGALRELRRMDENLKFPSSKKALKAAIERVESLQSFREFLVRRLTDKPFSAKMRPGKPAWSVQAATERKIEVVVGGKLSVFTWDDFVEKHLNQLLEIIQFYISNKTNTADLKLRERTRQTLNAAIYYVTAYPIGSPTHEFAVKAAKELVDSVVTEMPTLADDAKRMIPELLEKDGAQATE